MSISIPKKITTNYQRTKVDNGVIETDDSKLMAELVKLVTAKLKKDKTIKAQKDGNTIRKTKEFIEKAPEVNEVS